MHAATCEASILTELESKARPQERTYGQDSTTFCIYSAKGAPLSVFFVLATSSGGGGGVSYPVCSDIAFSHNLSRKILLCCELQIGHAAAL